MDCPDRKRIRYTDKGHQEDAWKALAPGTVAALRSWLNVRVGKKKGSLFTNFDRAAKSESDRELTGDGVYLIVKRTAKEAGVDRPVWPHAIRHTAITRVVNQSAKKGAPADDRENICGSREDRHDDDLRGREGNRGSDWG